MPERLLTWADDPLSPFVNEYPRQMQFRLIIRAGRRFIKPGKRLFTNFQLEVG